MWRVEIYIPRIDKVVIMDKDLGLFEADRFAQIYKRNNPACKFRVVNQENGDLDGEY